MDGTAMEVWLDGVPVINPNATRDFSNWLNGVPVLGAEEEAPVVSAETPFCVIIE